MMHLIIFHNSWLEFSNLRKNNYFKKQIKIFKVISKTSGSNRYPFLIIFFLILIFRQRKF